MTSNLLHYDNISTFKQERFKDLLTIEHLIPGEISTNKLTFTDGTEKKNANFWGWKFEKNGKKYLLASRRDVRDSTGKIISVEEIKIDDLLPIVAEDLQKVSIRGEVYYKINKVSSAKFKSIKCMSFKELIDTFCSIKHSNPTHQHLYWFLAMASMMDRCNFRVATPPAFGKDSGVYLLGSLVGSAATIENPTLAKLEWMTMYKWLVVSEIIDISKPEWKIIEQFLMATGAHKSEVTKHSRAMLSGTKDILNLKNFSLSLIYNDITDYPDPKDYIDFISKKATLDRFPAFRLYGTYLEDFNTVTMDNNKFVKENFDKYMELIYTYTYFKDNILKELKRFNADKLIELPQRHKTNIKRLLMMIDLYSDSQEEFDKWIEVINESITDYKNMLDYPELMKKLSSTTGDQATLRAELYMAKTFTEKKRLINNFIQKKPLKVREDKSFFEE